jgi:hypothetical protein
MRHNTHEMSGGTVDMARPMHLLSEHLSRTTGGRLKRLLGKRKSTKACLLKVVSKDGDNERISGSLPLSVGGDERDISALRTVSRC